MNILIVGSGAREHAIAKALTKSNTHPTLFCCGQTANPGLLALTKAYWQGQMTEIKMMVSKAKEWSIDMAFIGPELPLEQGITDALEAIGIGVVGPKQKLAQLETSKAFTRDLMKKFHIPGAIAHQTFHSMIGVEDALQAFGEDAYVIKADGLMSGKGVVQEPDAFLKRHLLKANLALFEKFQTLKLIQKVAFKDLGAGGIACASVELADAGGFGADIFLEKIPVSIKELPPHVVLCSETQERFLWLVPPDLVDMVLNHYNHEFALPKIALNAKATVIGQLRLDGSYVVHMEGEQIVHAKAHDITRGIVYQRPVKSYQTEEKEPSLPETNDQETLLALLAHENIASRAAVIETYDKQVQGRTLIEAGEANAGVLMPFNEEKYPEEIRNTGIALSLDQNPRYNQISPYWGAVNAVVESARNVAATGASPVAITDCLCFGNPEKPEQMWAFAESIRGMVDACVAIGLKEFPNTPLPVISGNVSLYNESTMGAIVPSPMISCLGSMPDATRAITSHFKKVGSHVVMVGRRLDECGGSVYYQLHHALGAQLPKPNLKTIGQEIQAMTRMIQAGLVLAAHDISDGGIAVSLAEMSFKNGIGVQVVIASDLSDAKTLFSETGGFVLEIASEKLDEVQQRLLQMDVPYWLIGNTIKEPMLHLQNKIEISLQEAKHAWENGLREKLI